MVKYFKEIAKLSIPVILAQLGTVLMGVTDMIMLGNYSQTDIAAVGVANQIYFLFSVIGIGAMAALTPLVAKSKGAKNPKECGEYLRTGIEMGFLIGIVLFGILTLITENFYIFNQPEEINIIAVKYLRMINISTVPYLLFIALKQFSDGLSLTKPAMYITLLSVLLNIFLNAVFIYGMFTFPAAGAKGAGVATVFARIFMAFALVVFVFKNNIYKGFLPNLVSTFNTKPVIVKLLKIGVPSGIQMFFEISAFAGTAILVGWLGVRFLAAHQILLGLIALIYTIAVGISVAGSIKVASSIGENQYTSVKKWGRLTFSFVTITMLLIGTSLIFFKTEIIQFFIKDDLILAIASSCFTLMVVFLILDSLQITGISLLRSIEDVKIPTLITIGCYLILGLPLSFVFGFILDYQFIGIWVGLIFAGFFSSLILVIRYFILVSSFKLKKKDRAKLLNLN
jgi:multidrug resistance protein, MATE family